LFPFILGRHWCHEPTGASLEVEVVSMLDKAVMYPTLPAQDYERARSFYADKLGLKPSEEFGDDSGLYETEGGRFLLFKSTGQASGTHTQMSFDVPDIHAAVKTLRENGVTFEEYDFPGFKSVDGIVDLGPEKGAWFKDSEGNLLALGERMMQK
jgi:catechol 2,3-dioxygenase-like lactoylglutathione lyase family enzyme